MIIAIAVIIRRKTYLAIIAVFAAIGLFLGESLCPGQDLSTNHNVTVSGTIVKMGLTSSGATQLLLEPDTKDYHRQRLHVQFSDSTITDLGIGDKISVTGRIQAPDRRYDMPYEKTPSDFWDRQGVIGHVYTNASSIIIHQPGKSIIRSFARCNDLIWHRISHSRLSARAQSFVGAIILGRSDTLLPQTRQQYSAAGLSHLLAISGLHVAIIAGLIAIFLKLLIGLSHRRVLTVVILSIIWGFVLLVGCKWPAVRAAIMISLLYLAYMSERNYEPTNALALSCIIILILSPDAIFEVGFQLSFLAVGGLVFIASNYIPDYSRRLSASKMASILQTPFMAILFASAATAYWFNEISAAGIIGNIFTFLFIAPLVGLSFIYVVLLMLSLDPPFIGRTLDWMHSVFEQAVRYSTTVVPHASTTYYPSPEFIAIYLIALTALVLTVHSRKPTMMCAFAVSIAGLIAIVIIDRPNQTHDVLLLQGNNGRTDLIHFAADASYAATLSTSARTAQMECLEEASERYSMTIAKSGFGSFTDAAPKGVFIDDNLISFADKYIAILDRKHPTVSVENADYILITGHYNSDPTEELIRVSPRHVILGADLHYSVRSRIAEGLVESGVSFTDLSKEGFKLFNPRRK